MTIIREEDVGKMPFVVEKCFLCSEPLGLPYIHWEGGDGERIGLHPDCAAELAQHLYEDAIAFARGEAIKARVRNVQRN